MDIRDVLRSHINDRGIKQCVIAKKAGMKNEQLSAVLTKRRKLNIEEMFSICRVIGIKPDDLNTAAQSGNDLEARV